MLFQTLAQSSYRKELSLPRLVQVEAEVAAVVAAAVAAAVAVAVAAAAAVAVAVAVAAVVAAVVARHMAGRREASCKHCIARRTRVQQDSRSEQLTTCRPGKCPRTGRTCGSLQDPV